MVIFSAKGSNQRWTGKLPAYLLGLSGLFRLFGLFGPFRLCLYLCLCLSSGFSALALAQQTGQIILATTTSTQDSGLLEKLLPPFEDMFKTKVKVVAVGTGAALKLGENGDADVVLVHDRSAEEAFVAAGHGVNRREVMYNDFVLVGPEDDPAGIKGERDVLEALRRVAEKRALFISRGDDSGTHKKEKALWQEAGITPAGKWYREAGQGMGAVLVMAGEQGGYTLADRGTYLAFKNKVPLRVFVEGDERLLNPYSIIAVNPARHPQINYLGAMQLIGWITSPAGQQIIGNFTIGGEPLFIPTAIPNP